MRGYAILSIILAVGLYFVYEFSHREFPVYRTGVVLITGCSSGIGKDAALGLAKEGYTVLAGVRGQKNIQTLKNEAKGLPLIPLDLDVTKTASIAAALRIAESKAKELNLPFVALVNNAGINAVPFAAEHINLEEARKVYDVNVFGVMEMSKTFIPLIRSHKGRIINIGSLAGVLSRPHNAVYAGTKFAVRAVSDAMRRELGPHSVAVSLIQPGYIMSNMMTHRAANKDPFKDLSTEQRTEYAQFYENAVANSEKVLDIAASTDLTTAAILDALINPRPRAVYTVGPVTRFMSGVVAEWVIWLLPDVLVDKILQTT